MADKMPDGCRQPEPVMIEISGNIKELTYKGNEADYLSLEECRKIFDDTAQKLADALIESLPQGIIEPLMIELMQKRVSLYHGVMK